ILTCHRVGKIADMGRLFGTDGIRGVAGGELSGELAFSLGRAAVVALTEQGERRPHIVVGRDTRASGGFLQSALSAGLCSAPGAEQLYLRHLEEAAGGRLDGLRVVVDCANGAASALAPGVLRRLGAEVVAIHDRPDGWNINDGCGATMPEVVARAVVEAGADA